MRMLLLPTLGVLTLVVLSHHVETDERPPLRGFLKEELSAERQREDTFRAVPQPDNLREYMRTISENPHHAGSPESRKVAEYVLGKFKSWGLNAWIEEYEALMPYPLERQLDLLAPESYTAQLKEPPVADDKDSGDAGQLPTFNAYSADGDVTGDVVYVNYGTPEDYEQLAKLKVDVKGRIVIARYGRSWRGIKPKVAWEHGAIGCLIYSDPKDDGYFAGDIFPHGAYRPWQGVQRGSVMDMPIHPGDPLTPGWGSEAGGRKLARAESPVLLKIPVLPISYGDAQPILRNLSGPVAPEDWRGALPMTYHVGPGASKVHMKLSFEWKNRPLYNVLARIDGGVFPDEWIIHGNHHDAWVNGADDPTSGNVALMETARGLAELSKQGWKPKRTIVLASWDGEEWGLLGSTEWAEKHAPELADKAVVYINSDSNGKGWLNPSGSHSLQTFVTEVARDVKGPHGRGSVFDEKKARDVDQAKTDEQKKTAAERREIPLEALGSGSDYTAFLDHLTVASLNLGFGGEGTGGVYHSIYDSFYWYTQFSDTDFSAGRALSQTIGTAILRLADATIVPFQFTNSSQTFAKYIDEIEKLAKDKKAPAIDLGPVRRSTDRLSRAAEAYEKALAKLTEATKRISPPADRLKQLNRLLYASERTFRYDKGLPKREWFRHLIYAPGFYTGYGVKTMPGIREGIEQGAYDEARAYVPLVAGAIEKLAAQVEEATKSLKQIAP